LRVSSSSSSSSQENEWKHRGRRRNRARWQRESIRWQWERSCNREMERPTTVVDCVLQVWITLYESIAIKRFRSTIFQNACYPDTHLKYSDFQLWQCKPNYPSYTRERAKK
jgi:hypothetical protein